MGLPLLLALLTAVVLSFFHKRQQTQGTRRRGRTPTRAPPPRRWWGRGWELARDPQGAHTQPRSPPFLLSEKLKEQAEKDKGKRGEWRALRPYLLLAEAGRWGQQESGSDPGALGALQREVRLRIALLPPDLRAGSLAQPSLSGPQNAGGTNLCTLGK